MRFRIAENRVVQERTDALILPVFKGEDLLRLRLPRRLKAHLVETGLKSGDFSGKAQEVFYLPAPKLFEQMKRIFLVGLGEAEKFDVEVLRKSLAVAVRKLENYKVENALLLSSPGIVPRRDWEHFGQIVAEAAELGQYVFDAYKNSEEDNAKEKLKELAIAGVTEAQRSKVLAGLERGRLIAEATAYTRDLANQPPNVMNPERLAEEAEALAAEFGMDFEVVEQKELEELQMNALLAVGKGSVHPPRLILLKYLKGKKEQKPIALVGKGVTFDSGGISLKSSKNMDEMKFDMAGGATVLGAMQAIAKLKLPLNVVGAVPAVENLPDGNASKPGDIVKAMNGKTIEILNTDAEGRLILADALVYVQKKYDPERIVDLATLTGAVVVALGSAAAAVMSPQEEFSKELIAAAKRSGERLWPLPLYSDYLDQIKSDIADIKNIGGGPAGVTVGGAFLSHFIDKDRTWAHIDIAGVAWTTKDTPLARKGATGYGVRLLAEWLSAQVKKN